jgi:hypothetical protein
MGILNRLLKAVSLLDRHLKANSLGGGFFRILPLMA